MDFSFRSLTIFMLFQIHQRNYSFNKYLQEKEGKEID